MCLSFFSLFWLLSSCPFFTPSRRVSNTGTYIFFLNLTLSAATAERGIPEKKKQIRDRSFPQRHLQMKKRENTMTTRPLFRNSPQCQVFFGASSWQMRKSADLWKGGFTIRTRRKWQKKLKLKKKIENNRVWNVQGTRIRGKISYEAKWSENLCLSPCPTFPSSFTQLARPTASYFFFLFLLACGGREKSLWTMRLFCACKQKKK